MNDKPWEKRSDRYIKGTINWYKHIACYFDEILDVEISDKPSTIRIILKPYFNDASKMNQFLEELTLGLDYEFITPIKCPNCNSKYMRMNTEYGQDETGKKYCCIDCGYKYNGEVKQ